MEKSLNMYSESEMRLHLLTSQKKFIKKIKSPLWYLKTANVNGSYQIKGDLVQFVMMIVIEYDHEAYDSLQVDYHPIFLSNSILQDNVDTINSYLSKLPKYQFEKNAIIFDQPIRLEESIVICNHMNNLLYTYKCLLENKLIDYVKFERPINDRVIEIEKYVTYLRKKHAETSLCTIILNLNNPTYTDLNLEKEGLHDYVVYLRKHLPFKDQDGYIWMFESLKLNPGFKLILILDNKIDLEKKRQHNDFLALTNKFDFAKYNLKLTNSPRLTTNLQENTAIFQYIHEKGFFSYAYINKSFLGKTFGKGHTKTKNYRQSNKIDDSIKS